MGPHPNTLSARLQHLATTHPDRPAFVFFDSQLRRRVFSRVEVLRLSARYAAILRRKGLKQGEIVVNTLPNSPERLLSDLGVILAGGVAMNGQLLLQDGADFLGSLKDSAAVAVILDPLQRQGAAALLTSKGVSMKEHGSVTHEDFPALRMILPSIWEGNKEELSFMDMLRQEPETYVADVTPDDLAYIWTTSGSTGFSKLVPVPHRKALKLCKHFYLCCGGSGPVTSNSDVNTARFWDDTGSSSLPDNCTDVFYCHGKLGWSGGTPGTYLAHGVTRVLLDFRDGIPDDLAAMTVEVWRRERCTTANVLPTDMQNVLSHLSTAKETPWRLRTVGLAGQPVSKDLVKRTREKVADSVNVFYGATDFGVVSCNFAVDPAHYRDCNGGKVMPGMEVKVVDESLKAVPAGQLGEITVRSDTVLTHYINNEKATENTLLGDGWARTGDVGYLSSDGDLYVVCRTSFGIMRGAYVLYPGWLETRISRCPGVKAVLVVPVPDPVLYQELCACVVTSTGAQLTEEKLRGFCEQLFLAGTDQHMTAVPRYFLFFDHLPITTTGKVCRRTVRQLALQRLNMQEKSPLGH